MKAKSYGLLALLCAAPAALSAQTAASSTLTVNCATSNGSYFYPSSRINVPFYYGCSFDSLGRLTDDVTFMHNQDWASNLVRAFISPETVEESGLTFYDAYLTHLTAASTNVMIAFSPPGYVITTLSTYQSWVDQILAHLRSTFPSVTFYVEAVNEPDLAGMSDATYYTYYQMFVYEVNKVNAANPSDPAMKVGGPVFGKWDPTRLQAFITNYGSDHTTGNRLDFFSYHDYASFSSGAITSPDTLAQLQSRRSTLEGWLTTNNGISGRNIIPLTTPCYVSEFGIYAGGNFDCGGYPITSAVLMQAASIATMNYYYIVNGNLRMTPLMWADRLDQHQEKAIFIPQSDQVLTPFGNTVKLFSKLQSTRVAATMSPDPTTTTSGFGVYALPTISSNQVAVLVWNWRHDDATYSSANISMTFSGLPSGFAGHQIKLTQYLIDPTHSNYMNGFSTAGLSTSNTVSNYPLANPYAFNLLNNAVSLIVLDPM